MIRMTASEVSQACGGRLLRGVPDVQIEAVVIDSRKVVPGACFFAIVGDRTDGHEYLEAAISAGASALVVHQDPGARLGNSEVAIIEVDNTTAALQSLAAYVRMRVDPRVVAITGSVGKTSTKHFTAALLQERWDVHSTPGNLNNHWGLPLSLLGLEEHHEIMVAELGMSGPGEIRDLARIARPQIGVITNVAPVHMEFFASVEDVAAAKAELAEELPPTGTLIVNAADPHTAAMATRFAPRVNRVLTFGQDIDADLRAIDAVESSDGWRFRLDIRGMGGLDPVDVRLPLTGHHTLMNFLAAAAIAFALETPPAAIAARASHLAFPAGRGETYALEDGVRVIDDSYNASPVAMTQSLDRLASLPADGRKIFAAGDMLELGSWSEDAHREVGEQTARHDIDLLVAVGDYAEFFAAGAVAGGMTAGRILCFGTSEEAGRALAADVRAGDLVLVKGSRGVHMERIIEALKQREPVARQSAED
jgi:UDP-N-acetylmuramoyl-tripeptide--D-alanyl-D-alanine ligase